MTSRTAVLFVLAMSLFASSCSEGAGSEARDSSAGESAGAGSPAPATPSATPPAAEMHAVVLVHGWLGSPRDMSALKRVLDRNGYRAFIAILPGDDNIANAEYLKGFVAEVEELTHVDSVDVVGFSMGGLSLRHYIRFLGGGAEVSRYVSIDTPQYGEVSACLLPAESGGQMCPFSDFLNELNTGDDTPGNVAYTTILNQQGNPAQGRLRGGAGELQVAGAHGDLLGSAEVHDAVLASLRR